MSWYFIDMEESGRGKIVKEHNCPQLELKLSSSLGDFHHLTDMSCTAETDISGHTCIGTGVWVCEGGWAGLCPRICHLFPVSATPLGSNIGCAV